MSNFKLNRRTFIASTGAILTLPLLESLMPRAFAAEGDPRRFVSFYFPNGTYHRINGPIMIPWSGTHGVLDNNLGAAFWPFAQYKNNFSIMNNWSWKQGDYVPAMGVGLSHHDAAIFLCEDFKGIFYGPSDDAYSFENMYADHLGQEAIVLYAGNQFHDHPLNEHISFRNGQPVRGLSNPGDLYRKLLQKVSPTAGTAGFKKASNGSILDSILTDITQLQGKVGRSDKQRLDQYFQGIRDLEARLGGGADGGGGVTPIPSQECRAPSIDPTVDNGNNPSNPDSYMKRFRAFNDLISIAFACDVARSVSIMFDMETSERDLVAPSEMIYENGDIRGFGAHTGGIAHSVGSTEGRNRAITRDRVLLSLVFDLVSKLQSFGDASGSPILDNTIIYAGYALGDGAHDEFLAAGHPGIIAGGRNFMATGRGIDGTKVDRTDMFFTFSRLLGMNLPSFGGSSKLVTFTE